MTRTTALTRLTTALLTVPLALALGAGTALGADHPEPASDTEHSGGAVARDHSHAPHTADPTGARAQGRSDDRADKHADELPTAPTGRPVGDATLQLPAAGSAPALSSDTSDTHGTATSGPLTSPQPLSQADRNGTGANPGSTCTPAYCSTRDGSASQNGKGDGVALGKPCAGCVGRADNKDPHGQAPNGTDHNAGYECDRNAGIGKGNPAHTGCASGPTLPPTLPPVTCPDGSPLPAAGATACPTVPAEPETRLHRDCPRAPVVGPVAAGCPTPRGPGAPPPPAGDGRAAVDPGSPIDGGVEAPATGPVDLVVPAVLPVSRPLTGTVADAAVISASAGAPSALPFTGADTALLLTLATLLLGAGTVLTVVTGRERTARAA